MRKITSIPNRRTMRAILLSSVAAGALLNVTPAFADCVVGQSGTCHIDNGITLTVDGALNSPWNTGSNGGIDVGEYSAGTLNIKNGGQVSSGYVYIGDQPGSTGTVTVDSQSTLSVRHELYIGYNGDGTLHIQNGSQVSSGYGLIGMGDNTTGTVLVDGAGTTWTMGDMMLGDAGNGTLSITGGARVISTNNSANKVGALANGSGTVLVDGVGSRWELASGTLVLGDKGTGALTISNGGLVSVGGQASFGQVAGSHSTVVVDGAGSKFETKAGLSMAGTSSLTVSDGGDVSASGDLIMNVATGALTISNGGSVDIGGRLFVNGNGAVNIGGVAGEEDAGAGTLNVGKLYFQSGNGQLNFNTTDGTTFGANIIGSDPRVGTINQYAGTTVLTGDNSGFAGQMNLLGGTLSVGADKNLGATSGDLNFNGGILQVTGNDFHSTSRTITWGDNGGGFDIVDANNNFSVAQALSGNGSLAKLGAGTLTLLGNNSYTGGTTISGGTLQLGNGNVDGTIVGDVVDNGSFVINNQNDTALSGAISGSGSLTQAGSGTLTLSGNNTYTGDTNFNNGVISVAEDDNLGNGGALNFNGGMLQVTGTDFNGTNRAISWGANGGGFDIVDAGNSFELSNQFTGSGGLTKQGAGTLALSGDSSGFGGTTNVDGGGLRLDGGSLGGTVHVASGSSLGGHGSIGGAVDIADGGTLFGTSGQQLSFGNGLTLGSNSNVDVTLNGGSAAPALFHVTGNLALDGKLNVDQGSAVGIGVYRIFDYTGTLTDNNMTIGTVADGNVSDYSLQSNIGHQVNLVSTGGRDFLFWDGAGPAGDGHVNGGSGTWNGANSNWTGSDGVASAPWHDDTFAVFQGAPGTVTIDNGFRPQVNGMQFMTSGYVLDGGPLTLGGTGTPLVIVGDGSVDSVNMVAEIRSSIEGNQGLTKSGAGNLLLTGANSYTGDTTIQQGTLTLGDGGSLNDQSNIILASTAFGDGTLAINKNQDFTLRNNISGTGDVVKDGTGTTTFAGHGSFTGGLTVKKGTAQAGVADDAFGAGAVTINKDGTLALNGFNETIGGLAGGKSDDGKIDLGSGTLTLNQTLHGDFSGVISGTGGITKDGAGDLVLYGQNDYSGLTDVKQGALVQGAGGGLSASSSYNVASGAEIDLGGFGTTMASLSNSGMVNFGGNGGTTLYVAGNYTGNGGTVVINTVLGGDHSQTDMLKVGGDTTGDTNLKVVNRGGLGGKTNSGIEVVDVAGQSDGKFSLVSDYTTKDGQKAVVGGAYAYTLQQGSGTGNKDGNWYLTSQLSNPGPNPNPDCKGDDCPNPGQRYSAGVPIYEGYASTLQALNKLPTLQERVGERYWTGKNGDGQTDGAAVDDKGVWARIEGAHNRLEPQTATGGRQDVNTFIMQAGVDGQFYEGDNGRLIAGITGQYGHGRADISSFSGDGDISTDAWSLGATTTWYGNNGFYVDGQAQVTWFDTDLNSDTANTGLSDSRKATGYAMSIEAGQRFAIDENWSLTPQAQLSYSSINANGFNDVWDSHVSLHDGDSLIGRIGLAANYATNWKGDDGLMVNTSVYGIANLYQEMLGGTVVNVAGTDFDTDNDKTWAGIGAGGSYAWADNKYAVYGEGSVNTGLNHFADSYALKGTVGFKVKW